MTGLACLVLAAPALAVPINPLNTRPVAVDPTAAAALQTQLNTTFGASAPDVNTGQNPAGMWATATGVPATSVPTLEISNGNPNDVFGIWFGTDTTHLVTYDLFNAGMPADGLHAASVGIISGMLVVNAGVLATCGPNGVNCGTLNDPLINPFSFGFYVRNSLGTFYTVDQLNAGGEAAALSYTDGNNNWLLAFNDGSTRTPGDFATYAVKTESIDPVPEPGTLALFGTALFGLAFALRSRQRATE
jgi:hypothetical protein